MVDYKEFSGDTLAFHWTAVYDEDGIETRTYYNPATNKVAGIEIRDANGMLRKFTEYNTDIGKVVCVQEFDEKERMVDYKEFSGDTLASHWSAVYDESGAETRTCYDAATGKVACVWEYDETGTLRRSTEYDTDTGKVVFVREFDERGQVVDCKGYENGTLSFHWSAVYDESGAQIRTYYDTVTGSASNIEKREYDRTNKTCTITQYDVQTDKMYRVQVWEMNGEDDWKLLKETYYDENGNVTSETVY